MLPSNFSTRAKIYTTFCTSLYFTPKIHISCKLVKVDLIHVKVIHPLVYWFQQCKSIIHEEQTLALVCGKQTISWQFPQRWMCHFTVITYLAWWTQWLMAWFCTLHRKLVNPVQIQPTILWEGNPERPGVVFSMETIEDPFLGERNAIGTRNHINKGPCSCVASV